MAKDKDTTPSTEASAKTTRISRALDSLDPVVQEGHAAEASVVSCSSRNVQVLWCGNNRQGASNRWSFPPRVARLLREEFAGKRICHLFGGFSTFGTRIDIDPTTSPHVLADAWLPPFVKDAFDVVILDPPYLGINQQMKQQLLRGASWIAKEHVVWFHTQWVAAGTTSCRFERGWLVRVGDSCAVRCIQVFRTSANKTNHVPHFTRGPAIRYNRWLAGQTGLPFQELSSIPRGTRRHLSDCR